MEAKRKGGLQSHFENFQRNIQNEFQSKLQANFKESMKVSNFILYKLTIHLCSQTIMRWITFDVRPE
ncbi:hypothetical protein JI735_25275 [Paenibacillus sonchi]|uniref:Uncharacterized protein n=1 Tax=Paenibacillus sonchi TaxID=373687 RepID=A0A974PAF0_9BACL|nr:hypothetical protein JI735_25275 [Paenibacillus sonchi]